MCFSSLLTKTVLLVIIITMQLKVVLQNVSYVIKVILKATGYQDGFKIIAKAIVVE